MISLVIPGIPPSLNNAYFDRVVRAPAGSNHKFVVKRILSTEGALYKKETTAYLAQRYRAEMAKLKPNNPYMVYFRFYTKVLNSGWPGKAKNRYRILDVSNGPKLLEDVLKDVAGVDDSCTMFVGAHKVHAVEEETRIWIWDLEIERSPLDVFEAL